MTFKSILCVFSGERYELNALSTAFTLRRECDARLRVLHIAEPPILGGATRHVLQHSHTSLLLSH